MNPETMTIEELREHRNDALKEARLYSRSAIILMRHAQFSLFKSYGYGAGALGMAAAYLYFRKDTAGLDHPGMKSLVEHYKPVCIDEAKDSLAKDFNAQHPTTYQIAMVDQCVNEFVSIHTTQQPSVDILAGGITVALALTACFQRFKSSFCASRRDEYLEEAKIANAFSEACHTELIQRREPPHLRLVGNPVRNASRP
jgi:hypothetical protein